MTTTTKRSAGAAAGGCLGEHPKSLRGKERFRVTSDGKSTCLPILSVNGFPVFFCFGATAVEGARDTAQGQGQQPVQGREGLRVQCLAVGAVVAGGEEGAGEGEEGEAEGVVAWLGGRAAAS